MTATEWILIAVFGVGCLWLGFVFGWRTQRNECAKGIAETLSRADLKTRRDFLSANSRLIDELKEQIAKRERARK